MTEPEDRFGETVASAVWGHADCDGKKAQAFLSKTDIRAAGNSLGDWPEDLLDGSGDLAIDLNAYARDLELNGDIFTVDDGSSVHVFWSR